MSQLNPEPPAPPAVRALSWLLAVTAAATVVVEVLIWWYADGADYGMSVRTGWAVLRALGFLLLIRHVRIGRASARPFGLILSVTTLFAVARLVVPKHGLPGVVGVLGFVLLLGLCTAVMLMLYKSPAVEAYLKRHPRRLTFDRDGIQLREVAPKRPPIPGWLLTVRVAGLAYGPLMLVAAAVAVGVLFHGKPAALPIIVGWFLAGFVTAYFMGLTTFFLVRGSRWPRLMLVALTAFALVVQLSLCAFLLGLDAVVRDGGPLLVTAGLALYGLWRTRRRAGAA
ncbi:hypothetical protein [Hamadaea tsunoensis]|uniref:hypothetical protein n=1 Tax=Hamadaea tsunoensis TaxID=53368 RepID=UPI0003FD2A9B|nr:hypothetical protein [Hamadaea tsunoensis]